MKKSRIVMGAMALAVAAGAIIACNKEKTAQQETITDQQPIGTKDHTLAEMIEAMSWEDGKAFFENQPVKDYTAVCEKVLNDCSFFEKTEVYSYGVSWNWLMAGGDCNPKYSGSCLIIKYSNEAYNQPDAIGFFENDKLVIVPTTDENGFTNDGYFVVGAPIEIQNDTIIVSEGVYSAYYDEEMGRYVAVAVDYYTN